MYEEPLEDKMFFQNTGSIQRYELLREAHDALQIRNEELSAHNRFLMLHNLNLFNDNKRLLNEKENIAQELRIELSAWREERSILLQEMERMRHQESSIRQVESRNSATNVPAEPGAMVADVPMEDTEEQRPKRRTFWRKKKQKKPTESTEHIQAQINELITRTWDAKKQVFLEDLENLRKRVLTITDTLERSGVVREVRKWASENEANARGASVNPTVTVESRCAGFVPHTGAIVKSARLRAQKQPDSEQDVSDGPSTSTHHSGMCEATHVNACAPAEDSSAEMCTEDEYDTLDILLTTSDEEEYDKIQDIPVTSSDEEYGTLQDIPLTISEENGTPQDIPVTGSEENEDHKDTHRRKKKPSRWKRFKKIFV